MTCFSISIWQVDIQQHDKHDLHCVRKSHNLSHKILDISTQTGSTMSFVKLTVPDGLLRKSRQDYKSVKTFPNHFGEIYLKYDEQKILCFLFHMVESW